MTNVKTWIKSILPLCALLGASALFVIIWISVVLFDPGVNSTPFFATRSPGGTYTVNFTGQKQRPFFFTNTVNYDVLKNGQLFLPSSHIHSGDALDISFELAYPNHRWLNEDILQLYREQYFNDGKPDTLVVINRTGQVIKYLKVDSVDKFLFFDLQPGAEVKLLNSPSRGDYKWLDVDGEFNDGRRIGRAEDLSDDNKLDGPFTYYVYVNESGVAFKGPI